VRRAVALQRCVAVALAIVLVAGARRALGDLAIDADVWYVPRGAARQVAPLSQRRPRALPLLLLPLLPLRPLPPLAPLVALLLPLRLVLAAHKQAGRLLEDAAVAAGVQQWQWSAAAAAW
jgi:hypothetical protein